MDYLNKLRSTVYSVKSQVNAVIPGNPVHREYDLGTHIASAGPGLAWKIYSATKKSTKQDVAVWIFEKAVTEKWPQRDRTVHLEMMKRGVGQLTRLRHPRLLIVEHPLEDSRDSIAFATEPVFCSLANALGRVDNMPAFVPTELTDLTLNDVEIRHGFLQLAEALSFLHNDAKLLHRNMCPESVIINKCGYWKLCGFDFCVGPLTQTDPVPAYPQLEWDPGLHPSCQPALDYVAPENIVGGRSDPAADIFSMGVLGYAVFNKGRTLMDNGNNLNTFKKNAQELKTLPVNTLRSLPEELREYVKMCLNFTPDLRPDATQFSRITYFDNVGVKTLNYLESLCQLDNAQKAQFYKGLPKVLTALPKRVQLQKVIPALTAEYGTPEMVPFVLPNVFIIAEGVTKDEFESAILPTLKPVFEIRKPVQVSLIILQKMELLLSKMSREDVRTYLLPVIYGALESDSTSIQELCLTIIPSIAGMVDSSSMKTHLVPKLMKLTANASVVSTKVNALLCIGKLVEHLEKWMVTEQILPALPKINSKEPGVLMAVLGIYHLAFTNTKIGISKELCAKSAIPFLTSMCVENSLNLKQFDSFMTLIRQMLSQVEKEQRAKLEQLSALQEEQRSGIDFNQMVNQADQKPPAANALDELAKTSSGSSKATTTSKGSLTLEEKQRLAREQEQALRFRSEAPLKPSSAGGGGKAGSANANCGNAIIANSGAVMNNSSLGSLGGGASPNPKQTSSGGPRDLTSMLGGGNMVPIPPPTSNPMSKYGNGLVDAAPRPGAGSGHNNTVMQPVTTGKFGGGLSAGFCTTPVMGNMTGGVSANFGGSRILASNSSDFGPMMGGQTQPSFGNSFGQSPMNMTKPQNAGFGGAGVTKGVDMKAFDSLLSFPSSGGAGSGRGNGQAGAFSTNLPPMSGAPFQSTGIVSPPRQPTTATSQKPKNPMSELDDLLG